MSFYLSFIYLFLFYIVTCIICQYIKFFDRHYLFSNIYSILFLRFRQFFANLDFLNISYIPIISKNTANIFFKTLLENFMAMQEPIIAPIIPGIIIGKTILKSILLFFMCIISAIIAVGIK